MSSDSVKLGDFGLSVQLKNMTKTQPNEVKKQRGTIRELTCTLATLCINYMHLVMVGSFSLSVCHYVCLFVCLAFCVSICLSVILCVCLLTVYMLLYLSSIYGS